MKAIKTFSFGGKNYNPGDAIEVDDVSKEKLLERKQISEGEGKEPEKEKADFSTKDARQKTEKVKKSDNPGAK